MKEKFEVTRKNDQITSREGFVADNTIFNQSNKAWAIGTIEEEFQYEYENNWEKFYTTRIKVTRLSGVVDYVPILVSDFLLGSLVNKKMKGKFVEVGGQFRSYNKQEEYGRSHLILNLFVRAINVYDDEADLEETDGNLIYLDGYICKPPVYRTTPSGREIADLLIAVNRQYGKSDYIPCIAWGRVARYASSLEVGNEIEMYGRMQSREYFKRFFKDSEEGEYRTAYEISIKRLQKVEHPLLGMNSENN